MPHYLDYFMLQVMEVVILKMALYVRMGAFALKVGVFVKIPVHHMSSSQCVVMMGKPMITNAS